MTVIDVPPRGTGHAVVDPRTTPVSGSALVDPRPKRRRGTRSGRSALRALGPLVVLAAWQILATAGVISDDVLASPLQVVDAGRELWASGELQHHLAISLQRVLIGLGFGIAVGLTLAVIAGLLRVGEYLVDPTVQLLRSIPALGLIPLVIIWFGVGETSKVFLIALGTTFPIYLNTYAAIRGVDGRLVEAGSTFGLDRRGLIGRVILPGALPGFFVGLRFALVGSWLIIIVAEQINAKSGLGYLINQAQAWYRTDIIVLGLVIYGVLGLIADWIVRTLERRVLVWRAGFGGT